MLARLKSIFQKTPNSEFHRLLCAVRDQYLEAYRRALVTYKQQFKPGGPEVTLRLNIPNTPAHFCHRRMDLASGAVSPPNLTEVVVENPLQFEPKGFQLPSGVSVTMHPFAWSGIDIITRPFPSDSPELAKWCLKWLDLDDKRPRDKHGFSGVTHCVTPPEQRSERWVFSVDFGSAPIVAFDELLTVLQQLGIESVTAGSFQLPKTARETR